MWSILETDFLNCLRAVSTARLERSGAVHAPNWNDGISSIGAIAELEEDWDGQGAEAPTGELIESALELANAFRDADAPPPCRIVAGVNGTITLEWQPGSNVYAAAEVAEPGVSELAWKAPGEPIRLWRIRSAVAV